MDKDFGLGSGGLIILRLARMAIRLSLLLSPVIVTVTASASPQDISEWAKILSTRVSSLETAQSGELGLYVKDLSTGQEFSFRGEESWYIASGVKIPIALEVLRQVDQGIISLATRVRLHSSDYLDGAGETNKRRPGSLLSVRYLLRQMLVYSDNTASDLLIKLVGLGPINQLVKAWVPVDFSEITTLAGVRSRVYGAVHPGAVNLTNHDFILLKSAHGEKQKFRTLTRLLKVRMDDLKHRDLSSAYSAYYESRLNSATLRAYGKLLEEVAGGKILKPSSTQLLMETLGVVQTGQARVKAGLPDSIEFAHKTGTQYGRICDFGIAWNKDKAEGKRVVIVACSRRGSSMRQAEGALKALGKAVYLSGVFSTSGEVPVLQ